MNFAKLLEETFGDCFCVMSECYGVCNIFETLNTRVLLFTSLAESYQIDGPLASVFPLVTHCFFLKQLNTITCHK